MYHFLMSGTIDNDKNNEIIVCAGQQIYIFNGVDHKTIWQSDKLEGFISGLSIIDIDNDGNKEIIVGTNNDNLDSASGFIYIYNSVNFTIVWQSQDLYQNINAIDVNDLDNDGIIEIIITGFHHIIEDYHYNEIYNIVIFNGLTHEMKWKSNDFEIYIKLLTTNDIDNDGITEIIYTSGTSYLYGYLFALNGVNYTIEKQSEIFFYLSGFSIKDIDNDSIQEIIIGNNGYSDNFIYILDGITFSQEWKSEEQGSGVNGITINDIDGDSIIELIVALGDNSLESTLYIFDSINHNIEWMSNEFGNIALTKGIDDLDNDNIKEIIIQGSRKRTYIYDSYTGELEWEGSFGEITNMEIFDIDKDGLKEIIVGKRNHSDFNYYFNIGIYEVYGDVYELEWESNPIEINDFCHGTINVAISDIDNDGTIEICKQISWWDSWNDSRHGFIYLYNYNEGLYKEKFKSSDLNYEILALCIEDIDNDGNIEFIINSKESKAPHNRNIRIIDAITFEQEWISFNITDLSNCLLTDDIDNDGTIEIITSGNKGYIYAYDGSKYNLEKDIYLPDQTINQLIVDDWDNDGGKELILCAGSSLYILNSTSYDIDWESTPAGDKYNLYTIFSEDIFGDEKKELIVGGDYYLYIYSTSKISNENNNTESDKIKENDNSEEDDFFTLLKNNILPIISLLLILIFIILIFALNKMRKKEKKKKDI